MTLINVSGGVKNGSCYSILRNVDGTKCLHPGRGNTVVNYEMGGTIYTIICLKPVCRRTQTPGRNSCSIVSGDVSN